MGGNSPFNTGQGQQGGASLLTQQQMQAQQGGGPRSLDAQGQQVQDMLPQMGNGQLGGIGMLDGGAGGPSPDGPAFDISDFPSLNASARPGLPVGLQAAAGQWFVKSVASFALHDRH